MFYLAKTTLTDEDFGNVKKELSKLPSPISNGDLALYDHRAYPFLMKAGIDTKTSMVGMAYGALVKEDILGFASHKGAYWLIIKADGGIYVCINGVKRDLSNLPECLMREGDDIIFYESPTADQVWWKKSELSAEQFAVRVQSMRRAPNSKRYDDLFAAEYINHIQRKALDGQLSLRIANNVLRSRDVVNEARNVAITNLINKGEFPIAKVPAPKEYVLVLGNGKTPWYVNSWIVLKVDNIEINERGEIVGTFNHVVDGVETAYKANMSKTSFNILKQETQHC